MNTDNIKPMAIYLLYLVTIISFIFAFYRTFIIEKSDNGLNISCFVYRDINRNSIYDMNDRPYAGLTVKLTDNSGKTISRKSNISGFTNFKMAFNNNKFDIYKAGKYEVQAEVPEDWQLTSNNAKQFLYFKELNESPAGIITEETCIPIGVAPLLTITGKYDEVISPEGKIIEIDKLTDGDYKFPVSIGTWIINIRVGAKESSREVNIKDYPIHISSYNVGRLKETPRTERITADFDTLTPSDTLYEIPNGYIGLNWTNWIATHQKLYKGAGYINSTVSSEYMAYNSSGHPASIWSEQEFDFIGGYIGVAWKGAEKGDVIIQGWRRNKLIYEDRFRASTGGAVYFDADYKNVTRLKFYSENYWQLVVDDMEFKVN